MTLSAQPKPNPKLSLALALEAAQATLAKCKAGGNDVAVTVVDPSGLNIVFLKSDTAPPHVIPGSAMKAYTIVCLGALMNSMGTSALSSNLLSSVGSSQVANIPGILLIQGGYLVTTDGTTTGTVLGAIGVAGSKQAQPGQLGNDEQCAMAGAAAIAPKIQKMYAQ
jgi:uncharacterized protein GlcG (DUF336 family)